MQPMVRDLRGCGDLHFSGHISLLDHVDRLRRAAIILGWAAMLLILFATLSPIDFRPHITEMRPNIERFVAYFLAGGLLSFAYPRQRWFVLAGIVVIALGLEWLQTLEATRHGRPQDAVVKIVGALIGGTLAVLFDYTVARFRRPA